MFISLIVAVAYQFSLHLRPPFYIFIAQADVFKTHQPETTGSTIAPSRNGDFFNEHFMAARHEEGCYEKSILTYFHVCIGLSSDVVGAAKGTVFQEIRPGAGFKTGDFVKEKLGGATIERLKRRTPRYTTYDSADEQPCNLSRRTAYTLIQLFSFCVLH